MSISRITNEILYEKIQEIIRQTTRTNGTIADIIKEIDRLKTWQNKMIGISMVVSSIILPILLYLLYLHIGK